MFKRSLNLDNILKRKSIFLFGPRQTGKSTLLKTLYPDALLINLLRPSEFLKYKTTPRLFGEEIEYAYRNHNAKLVVVDEVQKIPELLDEVHHLIEEHKDIRFILTGSSARKLKKAGVNLLGGRATRVHFHPIVSAEYGFKDFEKHLIKNLTCGFLPPVLTSSNPWADLEDYVSLYLQEEIQQEAVVRSFGGFSRFLNMVAKTNGQQLNFTDIGNDAQVPPRTVREYYQVLEDTLVGSFLTPYTKTTKRKAVATAKFYLFDPGIANFLTGRKTVSAKTPEFGPIFEQMIFGEIKAYLDYNSMNECLFYWRSTSQFEVDFLIRDKSDGWIAIEAKGSANPSPKEAKGMLALEEELQLRKKIIVCLADQPRLVDNGIEILPLHRFLEMLWKGDLVNGD
ncbi:MAG: ATP-binding protein [Proteobacteria bacterium]|nr:ATP-binding protein [Pseudomonadota bacterium]